MKRSHRAAALLGSGALVCASVFTGLGPTANAAFGFKQLNSIQQRLASGLLAAELDTSSSAAQPRTASPLRAAAIPPAPGSHGCDLRQGNNVKVNQNCLNLTDNDLQGRGQAQNEPWITVDPNNPMHLVASYNDYRRGDGTCGTSYSLDGGKTWADATTPNGFSRGDDFGTARIYWQASGDTSVAWDTKGNAYLSCQTFNRGSGTSPNPDQSSAFLIFRSTHTQGASWNFPGRQVALDVDTAGAGTALLDKQLMTVDNHNGSPFADRVYVTWTSFAADGTGYIYEAFSADYGESFSTPVLVSKSSPLCKNSFGLPTPQGPCNENQDSQPFTASDGTLYVLYSNFNNAVSGLDNHNQIFVVKSTNGGHSFSAPVLAANFYDLPDCDTYQGVGSDPGRACVPEKGSSHNSIFRAANAATGAVDPTDKNHIVIAFASYINRDSNEARGCTPAGFAADGLNLYTGVKDGGCNNDIVYSVSIDAGQSFSGGVISPRQLPVVTDRAPETKTDQFFQGEAFTPNGALVVSYYDRSFGSDNTTGASDISVAASHDRVTFNHARVTGTSMPPPTEFGGQFYGDYAGLDVTTSTAYPVWSDTRAIDQFLCPGTGAVGVPPQVCAGSAPNAAFANDEDIYTAGVPIP